MTIKKNYKKILILGSTGSGKTTLADKISKIKNIPHLGIDWIVYKKPWTIKHSNIIINREVKKATKKKKWVMEGGYSESWMNFPVKESDLVIILKLKWFVLFNRILKRYIKKVFNWKTKEKDTFFSMINLIKISNSYNKQRFLIHQEMINHFNKKFIILTNNQEIDNFLKELK
ncbi:hypothetical protein HN832_01660 [archaeon]|jgi:adenylate kinase family enzyme|nr:hypothetical protein [archaeon]MBT4373062.1 hypothetical protein [archaeon]MBT4531407.1 hypothetical protein [archaeon]MBT7001415.1 hypothetical protein [archaeon]MBT7282099.1 hypothetical protein [archaeon]